MISKFKKELLDLLREKSVIKRDTIKLASGKESNIFFDCKQTALTSRGHILIGVLFYNMLCQLSQIRMFNSCGIAGVELGGFSLCSAVSTYAGYLSHTGHGMLYYVDALYIRKTAKDHGTKNLIEGKLKPGSNVILFEDVITTGKSALNAATTLRDAGYNISHIFSIIDRLDDGTKLFKENGIELQSLFTIEDF